MSAHIAKNGNYFYSPTIICTFPLFASHKPTLPVCLPHINIVIVMPEHTYSHLVGE